MRVLRHVANCRSWYIMPLPAWFYAQDLVVVVAGGRVRRTSDKNGPDRQMRHKDGQHLDDDFGIGGRYIICSICASQTRWGWCA